MLTKLDTNSNFDDLHGKPWCQFVSKANLTSKEYCRRGHMFFNIDSHVIP